MSLPNLSSELPPGSSAQSRTIEVDATLSTPYPRTPTSMANSASSTLSQSPSNISCLSTGTFNANLRHTDHVMDPINVLSHPHESNPLPTGTPAASAADAAHKLQQLLKASTTDGVLEQSPEFVDDVGSVHSTGSSLKFAKGIVSGLFRANKSMATIPHRDSRRLFSPRSIFQKPNMTPPMAKAQVILPTEGSEDTSMAPDLTQEAISSSDEEESFSVLSLVRKSREKKAMAQALMNTSSPSSTSVVTQIHTPLDGGEDRSPSSDHQRSTSPSGITPVKPNSKNQVDSTDTRKIDEVPMAVAPPGPEAFFSSKGETAIVYSTDRPAESIRSYRSSFSIPARSIIRQGSTSSVLDRTPLAKDTREFRSKRGRKSGVDALTSALTSPTYRRKITSLTPPDDYKLPNIPGYISFPPYIPSCGLAMLFGNGEETWNNLKRFPSFRTKKGTNVVEDIVETRHEGNVEAEERVEAKRELTDDNVWQGNVRNISVLFTFIWDSDTDVSLWPEAGLIEPTAKFRIYKFRASFRPQCDNTSLILIKHGSEDNVLVYLSKPDLNCVILPLGSEKMETVGKLGSEIFG
ncbi:hypothetical protein HOY82DRAFT_636536 [Tuber indicum]|nr:hypothetical protein HOY82DRAFT_636536 [Tuber indicum]